MSDAIQTRDAYTSKKICPVSDHLLDWQGWAEETSLCFSVLNKIYLHKQCHLTLESFAKTSEQIIVKIFKRLKLQCWSPWTSKPKILNLIPYKISLSMLKNEQSEHSIRGFWLIWYDNIGIYFSSLVCCLTIASNQTWE